MGRGGITLTGEVIQKIDPAAVSGKIFTAVPKHPKMHPSPRRNPLRAQYEQWTKWVREGCAKSLVCPSISVLTPTNRPEDWPRVRISFTSQNYPNKELLILVEDKFHKMAKRFWSDVDGARVICTGKASLGGMLNLGCERADGEFASRMDGDDYYHSDYLMTHALMHGELGVPSFCGVADEAYFFAATNQIGYWGNRYDRNQVQVVGGNDMLRRVSGHAIYWPKRLSEHIVFPEKAHGEDIAIRERMFSSGVPVVANFRFISVVHKSWSAKNHTCPVMLNYYKGRGVVLDDPVADEIWSWVIDVRKEEQCTIEDE